MTGVLHTLSRIAVPFPEREVFLRLGGRTTRTAMTDAEAREYRKVALEAFEMCELRGRWAVFPARAEETGVRLDDGTLIPGTQFARRSAGIRAVWCGAVTAGAKITAARDAGGPVARSAVYDAVGGECADAGMAFMQRQAATQLRSGALGLRESRYSPGYGDMPLEVQKFFFARLKLEELGMKLDEHCFMLPEKSVTAFAGVD